MKIIPIGTLDHLMKEDKISWKVKIQDAVKVLNQTKSVLLMVLDRFIKDYHDNHYNYSLQDLTHGVNASTNFWTSALVLIHHTLAGNKYSSRSSSELLKKLKTFVDSIIYLYPIFMLLLKLLRFLNFMPILDQKLINLLVCIYIVLYLRIGNFYCGQLTEIITRIKETTSIETELPFNKKEAVKNYLALNDLLPAAIKRKISPSTSPKPSFVLFTETMLYMLLGGDGFKNKNGFPLRLVDLKSNNGRMISTLFGQEGSQKIGKKFSFLDDCFDFENNCTFAPPNGFIMGHSIVTNGYQVNIHLLDFKNPMNEKSMEDIVGFNVCGVDYGERYSLGVSYLKDHQIKTLKLKKLALNLSSKKFHYQLESVKRSNPYVFEIERRFRRNQDINQELEDYNSLANFYGSKRVMKMNWNLKVARKAEWNYAIDRYYNLVVY